MRNIITAVWWAFVVSVMGSAGAKPMDDPMLLDDPPMRMWSDGAWSEATRLLGSEVVTRLEARGYSDKDIGLLGAAAKVLAGDPVTIPCTFEEISRTDEYKAVVESWLQPPYGLSSFDHSSVLGFVVNPYVFVRFAGKDPASGLTVAETFKLSAAEGYEQQTSAALAASLGLIGVSVDSSGSVAVSAEHPSQLMVGQVEVNLVDSSVTGELGFGGGTPLSKAHVGVGLTIWHVGDRFAESLPDLDALMEHLVSEGTRGWTRGGSVMFVLDRSGSMNCDLEGRPAIEGFRRIDMAKLVLTDMLAGGTLYDELGLVDVPWEQSSCDAALNLPLAPNQQRTLFQEVIGTEPPQYDCPARISSSRSSGGTPLAEGIDLACSTVWDRLEEVRAERGRDGRGRAGGEPAAPEPSYRLVVLTDGQETCGGNPIEIASKWVSVGLDVDIFIVGFDVDDETQEQLEDIATAGGGLYFDADDADELEKALDAALAPEERRADTLRETLHVTNHSSQTLGVTVSVYRRDETLHWPAGSHVMAVQPGQSYEMRISCKEGDYLGVSGLGMVDSQARFESVGEGVKESYLCDGVDHEIALR